MSACQPSGAAAAPQQQAGGSGAAHAAPAAPPSVQPVQAAPPSFATYADEVRASLALLRSLLEELDATGREPDWERLRGRPGIRLDPITWRELTALVADGSERALGSLGRTPLQIKQYWDYRDAVVLKQWASVPDYLQWKIFGFETAAGEDGRRVALVPPGFFQNGGSAGGSGEPGSTRSSGAAAGSGDSSTVAVWRVNDFPYFTEAGITHYNLWASRPLSGAEVEAHIAARRPPGADVTWFVNPPSVQSVPSIWHAHIFIRQRQEPPQQQQQQQQQAQGRADAYCN